MAVSLTRYTEGFFTAPKPNTLYLVYVFYVDPGLQGTPGTITGWNTSWELVHRNQYGSHGMDVWRGVTPSNPPVGFLSIPYSGGSPQYLTHQAAEVANAPITNNGADAIGHLVPDTYGYQAGAVYGPMTYRDANSRYIYGVTKRGPGDALLPSTGGAQYLLDLMAGYIAAIGEYVATQWGVFQAQPASNQSIWGYLDTYSAFALEILGTSNAKTHSTNASISKRSFKGHSTDATIGAVTGPAIPVRRDSGSQDAVLAIGATQDTGSVAFAARKLYMLSIAMRSSGIPDIDQVTGGGITWSKATPTNGTPPFLAIYKGVGEQGGYPGVTVSPLLSARDTVDRTSYATQQVSPTPGRLLVIDVFNAKSLAPTAVPVISGLGLTWVQEATVTNIVDQRRLTRFYAWVGASPVPGPITIDFAGVIQIDCAWAVYEVDGADLTTPFEASVTNDGTAATTNTYVAELPNAESHNRPLVAIGHMVNEDSTLEAGYTELADLFGAAGLGVGFVVGWNPTIFDHRPTATWVTASSWVALASEIKARLITGVSTGPLTMRVAGAAVTALKWAIDEITTVDPADPIGQAPGIVGGTRTSVSLPLATFEDANDTGYGVFVHNASEDTVPGAGMTELGDDASATTPPLGLETAFHLGPISALAASWATQIASASAAFEIRAIASPKLHQSADGLVKSIGLTKTHSTNAIIRKTSTKTQSADARVIKPTNTKTQSADALISKTGIHKQQSADAIVEQYLAVTSLATATGNNVSRLQVDLSGTTFTPNAWLVVDAVAYKDSPGFTDGAIVSDSLGSVWRVETDYLASPGTIRLGRYFSFIGASTAGRIITIDWQGNPSTGLIVSVYQLAGLDEEVPFLQTAVYPGDPGITSIATALSPFQSAADRTLVVAAHNADEASTQEGGYTEISDTHISTGPIALAVAWQPSAEDDTPSYSWATASDHSIVIGSEMSVNKKARRHQYVEAVIHKTLTTVQSIDAQIAKVNTKTQSADARLLYVPNKQHSTDTWIQAPFAKTQSVTAVIRKHLTVGHSTNAFLKVPFAGLPPFPTIPRPDYRLALAARSSSGLGQEIISDVFGSIGVPRDTDPLRYTETLNEAGSLEFIIPIDHPLVTRANFARGQREIHLYRNNELVWAGKLWVADVQGWFVRFVAYGWYFDLTRRERETDYSSRLQYVQGAGGVYHWTHLDQFDIVRELIAETQARTGGGLGIQFYDTSDSGITRAITVCAEERRQISDIIEELASARDGFDYAILPDKRFRMWYPRRSSQTAIQFTGVASISELAYQDDATELATEVAGIGPQEECAVPHVVTAQDPTGLANYGLLQGSVDLQEIEDQDMQVEIVAEALFQNARPRFQTSVKVDTLLPDAPDPKTYGVGDIVSVRTTLGAPGGFGDLTLTGRILSRVIEVDQMATERTTLTLDVETTT